MSRKPKKYHYIYKTTCKITGKFYVGMHSSDSLDDGYLGSGKILGYSRKKYGDENHVREILEMCSSRDELKQREKEIVNEALLADPLNINLRYGGEGGGGWKHLTDEQQIKFRRSGMSAMMKSLTSEKLSLRAKKIAATRKQNGTLKISKNAIEAARFSEKRKHTMRERNHAKGEKNSQYGTCWINNSVSAMKIKRHLLPDFISNGWKSGRKLS